jgi:hypothetical protein
MARALQEGDVRFCQQPSEQYKVLLDLAQDDPRLLAGRQAIQDLQSSGGWAPTIDARDARVEVPVTIPNE